jgi:ATP-dependent DNA helicase RecG
MRRAATSGADGERADAGVDPGAPLTELRGIGPATADRLAAVGVVTLGDLLWFFPRRHGELLVLDVDSERPGDDELRGRPVRLTAVVERARTVRMRGRGGRSFSELRLVCCRSELAVTARFFNQPWLGKSLEVGRQRTFEGVLEDREDGPPAALEQPRLLSVDDPMGELPCTVRYPAVEGIGESRLRALVGRALAAVDETALARCVPVLPPALRERFLPSLASLRAMHLPANVAEHERARATFAVLEAVGVFRALEAARARRSARRAPPIEFDAMASERLRVATGLRPTEDQERAIAAIRSRMRGPAPMALLLQGDVGTGKTLVALDAIVACAAAGHQVAFLAPTRLLAEQHAERLVPVLESLSLRAAVWTGVAPAEERRRLAERVAEGRIDVVIGTQALGGPEARFARLGLVVVDEQHRFGVEHRANLAAKGGDGTTFDAAHVLVLTATPIPRTSAMVRFGDLDVVELRERPGRRALAPAVFVPRDDWPRVLRAIRRHVRRGGGVFVVCPKIGADGGKGGVDALSQSLASQSFRTAVVHGQKPVDERRAVVAGFRDRSLCDVLVATTVIEVGLDVPDATLMVVVQADRFGAATLHQLRGRVGRGKRRGLCILTAPVCTPRIDAVVRTRDGFELAEIDFLLRGSGELLGRRQSGVGELRALDVAVDGDLLDLARRAVAEEARAGGVRSDEPAAIEKG